MAPSLLVRTGGGHARLIRRRLDSAAAAPHVSGRWPSQGFGLP